jgi:hypothetical protein
MVSGEIIAANWLLFVNNEHLDSMFQIWHMGLPIGYYRAWRTRKVCEIPKACGSLSSIGSS